MRARSLFTLSLLSAMAACGSSSQDAAERRRDAAKALCETAIAAQLRLPASTKFDREHESFFYDTTGGGGITGSVPSGGAEVKFACVVQPDADSSWNVIGAKVIGREAQH